VVTEERSNSALRRTQSAIDASPERARTTSRRSTRFEIRRVYDIDESDDSYRVLVDRLWPRGISKAKAALDDWAKDLAPGTELREWYRHDPAKFELFARRYRQELKRTPAREAVARLRAVARHKRVTLLTATRDLDHSGARVLKDVLTGKSREERR
jgi:uncharacterized protein YeaO (DUF488 family)